MAPEGESAGADELAMRESDPSRVETMALTGREGDLALVPLNDPSAPMAKRVIYFEFDSSEVKSQYVDLVAEHGELLAQQPRLRVRLEGHTDERGSREYNVALGERRGLAVRRLLMVHGVTDGQVETVSFGEEVPAAPGHAEEAWSLNRRVELVYEGQ
jgi:peptidoglycan-associated lipoprotein